MKMICSDPRWFKIKYNNPITPNATRYVHKNHVEVASKSVLNEILQPKPIRQQRAFMDSTHRIIIAIMTSTIQFFSFTVNTHNQPFQRNITSLHSCEPQEKHKPIHHRSNIYFITRANSWMEKKTYL